MDLAILQQTFLQQLPSHAPPVLLEALESLVSCHESLGARLGDTSHQHHPTIVATLSAARQHVELELARQQNALEDLEAQKERIARTESDKKITDAAAKAAVRSDAEFQALRNYVTVLEQLKAYGEKLSYLAIDRRTLIDASLRSYVKGNP